MFLVPHRTKNDRKSRTPSDFRLLRLRSGGVGFIALCAASSKSMLSPFTYSPTFRFAAHGVTEM